MDLNEALSTARSNAAAAIDQIGEYASAEDAVWSYWQNVRDTLAEYRASEYEAQALEAFWAALPADLAKFR